MSFNLFWQSLQICSRAGSHYSEFKYIQFLAKKNKLTKISQVPNIDSGRIRPTCMNQTVTDWNIGPQDLFFLIRFHSRVWLFADFFALLSTATREFQLRIRRADFAGLAFMLLLAPLAIEENCLAVPSLQNAASNRIQS